MREGTPRRTGAVGVAIAVRIYCWHDDPKHCPNTAYLEYALTSARSPHRPGRRSDEHTELRPRPAVNRQTQCLAGLPIVARRRHAHRDAPSAEALARRHRWPRRGASRRTRTRQGEGARHVPCARSADRARRWAAPAARGALGPGREHRAEPARASLKEPRVMTRASRSPDEILVDGVESA